MSHIAILYTELLCSLGCISTQTFCFLKWIVFRKSKLFNSVTTKKKSHAVFPTSRTCPELLDVARLRALGNEYGEVGNYLITWYALTWITQGLQHHCCYLLHNLKQPPLAILRKGMSSTWQAHKFCYPKKPGWGARFASIGKVMVRMAAQWSGFTEWCQSSPTISHGPKITTSASKLTGTKMCGWRSNAERGTFYCPTKVVEWVGVIALVH